MAIKQARGRVSGEVELFFEKPGGGDLKVKPFERGKIAFDVDGKKIWLVPELAEKSQANIVEGLTHVVSSANALDRNLALVYSAAKKFREKFGEGEFLIPFRHGQESEAKEAPRNVVGGHIQYQSPLWRGSDGQLNLDEIIGDSQKIRSFALPFIYVDAGIGRACRSGSPCTPSSRLFLRNKTRFYVPEADKWILHELPTSEYCDVILSAEDLNVPGEKALVRGLSLEVRNPPAGPAMGKHALDILVAVKQAQVDVGFNVPSKQKSDVWGVLEEEAPKLGIKGLDIPHIIYSFQAAVGSTSLSDVKRILNSTSDDKLGAESKVMKNILNRLGDSKFKTRESDADIFEEYIETAKNAARLRYRAPVKFAGGEMLMRDAYASHYLKNRRTYDSADPAVYGWVRAATDNGFSYTDFRLALRGFFQDRDRFNMVVDDIMAGAFRLGGDGRRPTMASVLNALPADYLNAGDRAFLRGLSVFLSHRQSNTADEGRIPDGIESRGKDGNCLVRIPAADIGKIEKLLDAGFMFYRAGKMPDGGGYFELEYNPTLKRDVKLREALRK